MVMVTKENASRKALDFFERGFSAMDRKNLDYAMEMFLHALEVEPGFFDARKFMRAASLKKFRDAKKGSVAHLISSLTNMPAVIGANLTMNRKPLKALLTADKLLCRDPLNPLFVFLLCDASDVVNMPEVAVQSLELLRDDNPNKTKVLERLAEAYKDNEQMAEARDIYDLLRSKRPNDQDLLKKYKDTTALATMQQGGWETANSYRDVMKDAQEAGRLEQQAKAVMTTSDLESLIEADKEKIAAEPSNANHRRSLANLYYKAGRLEEATDTLREAQTTTGTLDPQLDRFLSQIRMAQFDRDINSLREDGDEAGAAMKESEKEAFLLEDAKERVQRYPNDREFKYELGVMLSQRGEIDGAIQQFQQSQRNPKFRVDSLYQMAMCFREKGLNDLAREQLNTAAGEVSSTNDTKKNILYELGQIAEDLGEEDEAIRLFKEIYAGDIGFKDVAAKIEQSYGKAR